MCTGVSVAATNSIKAAIAEVSEVAGFPGKPKRSESGPSRMTPLDLSWRSQHHSATGFPKGWRYSNTRRTSAVFSKG